MWDCPNCGCMNIAASLEFCPQCFKVRGAVPEPSAPDMTINTTPVETPNVQAPESDPVPPELQGES
jgi:hypothetical protein